MKPGPENQPSGRGSASIIGVGAALGLVAGVVLGTALENLAVGIGLGMAVGIAVSIAIDHHDRQLNTTADQPAADQQRRTLITSLLIGLFVLGLVGLLIFYAARL
jgi:hypothetical protein